MFDNLDPVILARIQFAFTISFHILFPAFTIGLASWLAVLEWRWLKTGHTAYAEIYRMWVKIFAVTFGMGVVSGVVMSFQFGTNWSVFSDSAGNVLGPLLGFEVLTAFFLEAPFLGVMLFGWNRVSPRMHFAATVIVAAGTLFSAFWILSANSWMQTPQGFRVGENGILFPTNWLAVIFNPSFPYRLAHMINAAYLTTAFVVAGIGAFYLWRGRHIKHARIMFGMAMIMAVFVAPLQLLIGDLHGSWDDWDVSYFNNSDYDLLLFTGDLGSGTGEAGVRVARSIARLAKQALVLPGNNDVQFQTAIAAELSLNTSPDRRFG